MDATDEAGWFGRQGAGIEARPAYAEGVGSQYRYDAVCAAAFAQTDRAKWRALTHWTVDWRLASIREEEELVKLAPEEQKAFRTLWREVEDLRQRAKEARR